MEKRKIQKTGGSTFIVSLPKDWAKTRLEEGDYVYIDKEENSLRINLEKKGKGEKKSTLQYEEPLGTLLRKIIGNYLVGYDKIKIKSSEVIEKKKKIKELVRENLMGMGITTETSKEIVLQNLLKYSGLPTPNLLKRIDSIIKEMYKDVLSSFKHRREEVLKDVRKRENEVDRLYLLGVRQIKASVRDDRIRRKLKIQSNLFCLGYRLILKSLERTGDHLKRIAKNLLEIKEVPEKKRLINLGKGSLSSYNKGIKSLFDIDGELAEDSIRESKETDRASEELMKKELPEKTSFKVKTIIRSMDRTRKLTRDIAEIVINLVSGEAIKF